MARSLSTGLTSSMQPSSHSHKSTIVYQTQIQSSAPAIKAVTPVLGQKTPTSTIASTPVENVVPVAMQLVSTSANNTLTVSPAISSVAGDGGSLVVSSGTVSPAISSVAGDGGSLVVSSGTETKPDNGPGIAIAVAAALLFL